MEWYNEPPHWEADGQTLRITSGPQTDFWRKTHSGLVRDHGHFYFQPVTGDFVAEVKVSGTYPDQYDQSGLMLRLDEQTWLKCGIEVFNAVQYATVVITRDFSDYSLEPLPHNPSTLWLRVVRQGITIEVYCALDGQSYRMIRQAYLTHAETLSVGLMAASPIGNGFTSTFEEFQIRAS